MDDIIDIGNNYENVMAIYNDYFEQGHTCQIFFNNFNKIKIMVPEKYFYITLL